MKRIIIRLSCLCLLLSLMLCGIPVWATEATDGEESEAASSLSTVIVLKDDVPRGTRITEKLIEAITVSKGVPIPSNALTDIGSAVGKYAGVDLYSGEYIHKEQLSSKSVAKINSKLLLKPITESTAEYVIVTDYVRINTGEDISYFIQEIIDNNPQRTIYFPDGEYVIASPLNTASAPNKSVSLQLSDGAVIKAADNWKGQNNDGLINLGALTPSANDINSVGSYYSVMGGTLDCNNRANGIVIAGGRESVIRNICIKRARIGIFVDNGVNGNSSDCDFEDITILGSGLAGTTGIRLKGNDNTFSNIRIYNMSQGFSSDGDANFEKSIYVTNTNEQLMSSGSTVGFFGVGGFSQCFAINCDKGFEVRDRARVSEATVAWTEENIKRQVAYGYSVGNAVFGGCRVYFKQTEGGEYFVTSGTANLEYPMIEKN